jgi:ABC-type glycerol-3-phosphate transport system substrate-binding protein
MTKAFRRLGLAAVAVGMAALAGCSFGTESAVRLITNRSELAAYVDRFNSLQGDVKVEISYQEVPSQAVLDGVPGDVVIGEWLASPAVMDRLDSLADLVKPGKLDPSWFYARFLDMGSRDNRPILIPVSFTLPAIAYMRSSADLANMFMPLDALESRSHDFNKTSKAGTLTSVGFSPFWNPDFLTETALLFGARFRPGRNGLPAFDEGGVAKTVDFARSWMTKVNNGPAVDAAFANRNLVQPWYKLLSSGRILFALTSFTEFFALPEEKRRDFDFRWLSQDNLIPVMDNALFAGVTRSSRQKAGARTFLSWFCSFAVQQSLLAVNQSRRIGVFGVTDGFSALKSINEKDLPQKYPLLLGHIPMENILAFPGPLPDNWVKVRDAVIRPWIEQAAAGQESDPLEKKLEDWQKSQKK